MSNATSLDRFLQRISPDSRERFSTAYRYAHAHLSTVDRYSGESYFAHGVEVAQTLWEVVPDSGLLVVLLLHDLLIHPDGPALLRAAPLTEDEKGLVYKMHRLRRLDLDRNIQDLNHVIGEFTQDARLPIMRMAHRLNDVRHLGRFTEERRHLIASESLYMYTSIAGRLGLHSWRHEMEEACFKLLYPRISRKLALQYELSASLDTECLRHVERYIRDSLEEQGIPAQMGSRIKGLYSTYRKMIHKKRAFSELTDRLALRVITDTRENCYRVLSVVHSRMHPIPGKLKDYIGAPKENGYQSLHTVVYPLPGITQQPIEIQIRTREMHEACEYGIVAHHRYKDQTYVVRVKQFRVDLFKNLEVLKANAHTPQEFQTALRAYFQGNNLVIFDSDDRMYHMKKPATALDFVCLVYGNRSRKLKRVRINGRPVGHGSLLQDGDVVQVEFGRTVTYQRTWREYCRHTGSKKSLCGPESRSRPSIRRDRLVSRR